MAKTVYWDACVFHAMFGNEAGRVDACSLIEKSARENEVEIYTSTVTYVECVWLKGSPKIPSEHEEKIQRYFMHKFIKPINCDRIIAESARSLLWKHSGLHPKDAIHVASAINQQLETLHTYDDALLKLSGKIGTLKICKPEDDPNFRPKAKDAQLNFEPQQTTPSPCPPRRAPFSE